MGDELAIDWKDLLKTVTDELNFDFCDQSGADGLSFSNAPDSGCCTSIDDIEQYLLNDEFDYQKEDDQICLKDVTFSDVSLYSVPESESDRSKDTPSSPEPAEVATEAEENDEDRPRESTVDAEETNRKMDVVGDDSDPSAKKRKRQMRNRDAAVRSRERKKIYVTDLEMKSKFYEAECRRLGNLLHCCIAENQALRLSLHHTMAYDASMAKQESAVLLMESLLLGSLLGFLGIICLLILPSHLLPTLEASHATSAERGNGAPKKVGSKIFNVPFHTYFTGRRYRASRTRMKKISWLFPAEIIY